MSQLFFCPRLIVFAKNTQALRQSSNRLPVLKISFFYRVNHLIFFSKRLNLIFLTPDPSLLTDSHINFGFPTI